eukprot:jgi/Botrbrau1/10344/Bobra.0321s0019.1
MIAGRWRNPGEPEPPNLLPYQISFVTPVIADWGTLGCPIGSVIEDVTNLQPFAKGDTVSVKFQGANPRNNLHTEGSFLFVQKREPPPDETWSTVAIDDDISTRFIWTRTNTLLGQSEVTITWTIPQDAEAGVYRIVYSGDKLILGTVEPFTATSNMFKVLKDGETAPPAQRSWMSFRPGCSKGPSKLVEHLCLQSATKFPGLKVFSFPCSSSQAG